MHEHRHLVDGTVLEEFEDTKSAIRYRISKKIRQRMIYNFFLIKKKFHD